MESRHNFVPRILSSAYFPPRFHTLTQCSHNVLFSSEHSPQHIQLKLSSFRTIVLSPLVLAFRREDPPAEARGRRARELAGGPQDPHRASHSQLRFHRAALLLQTVGAGKANFIANMLRVCCQTCYTLRSKQIARALFKLIQNLNKRFTVGEQG